MPQGILKEGGVGKVGGGAGQGGGGEHGKLHPRVPESEQCPD